MNIIATICADWLICLKARRGSKNLRLTTNRFSLKKEIVGWSDSFHPLATERGGFKYPPPGAGFA